MVLIYDDTIMITDRKLNNVRKSAHYGPQTIHDITITLSKHTDLNKLTGKQIGELVNAMYESYRLGFEADEE